jgi:1-acyl-sn-glycerol-3-phosphate acyltransferase
LLAIAFLFDKLLPFSPIKKLTQFILDKVPGLWVFLNRIPLNWVSRISLEVDLPKDLDINTFYLVTANHQSWADIPIMYDVFTNRIPMLKSFMKQQLRWIPLVGQAPLAYGFPLLYRNSKPKFKNRDLEATRKACERFKHQPGSIMIYAEGTRFTEEKYQKQQSPYRHLLKPKAGGLALGLKYMDNKINTLIDVTIIYSRPHPTFWDYCSGKINKIIVKARAIPIPSDLRGDYENDQNYRRHFQQFLNQIWLEKDKLISSTIESIHEK